MRSRGSPRRIDSSAPQALRGTIGGAPATAIARSGIVCSGLRTNEARRSVTRPVIRSGSPSPARPTSGSRGASRQRRCPPALPKSGRSSPSTIPSSHRPHVPSAARTWNRTEPGPCQRSPTRSNRPAVTTRSPAPEAGSDRYEIEARPADPTAGSARANGGDDGGDEKLHDEVPGWLRRPPSTRNSTPP